MPGTTRPAVLSAAVLSVLTAGVVSALSLQPGTAGPRPVAQAATVAPPGPVVVVPAAAVAPLPFPLPDPEPVPPAPAPAAPAPPAAVEAPAPTPPADDPCSGPGWQQRRGAAALASLRHPSDAAPFDVRFTSARAAVIGLATLHERRLEVFVRPCDELSDGLLRHVVAHELGHLVDVARLSDADRAQWRAARGIPAGTPWYGCDECTDFATPAGDFAEVYAQWQRGASSNRSELAGAPSAGELAQLAARFWG